MDFVSPRGDAPQDTTAKTDERRPAEAAGRRRTRSIRTRVTALLLVPLLSLIALWGYAANVTGRDALAQRRYHTLDVKLAPTGQAVLVELGKERQASAVFLSTPRESAPAAPSTLDQQRRRLDAAIEVFRKEATSSAAQDAMPAALRDRVNEVIQGFGGLTGLRSAIDARSIERLTAINYYSTLVDDVHRVYDRLEIDDADLYNATLATRHAGRAIELLQRENALIASALITGGRMTAAEHRTFVEMLGEQRWHWTRQRSLLDREVYAKTTAPVFASPVYQSYHGIEDRIADADPRRPLPIRADEWQRTAQQLVLQSNDMLLANSRLAGEDADRLGRAAYVRLGVVGGLGLLAILVSVLLSLWVARGFVRELVGLRGAAEELADRRLPALVGRLSRNETVDVAAEAPPLETGSTTEVARLADSFAKVQRTAVDAAVGQAELRAGVRRIFLNIARRNQSLLHRQLSMLDALESRAEPDDLEDLFRIDHLTTRMRRHAESLIILSGATPARGWRHPVRFADVLRAAVSEIEDYTRVAVLTESADGLVGSAVTDVVHLLAELLENATTFSPPTTEVRMMAERVGTGFAIEIEDRGLGVRPEQLDEANRRLAEPPEYDLVDTDQLGLFVVARLAARHAVNVSLQRSPYGGVTAIVLLPHELVVPAEQMAEAEAAAEIEPGDHLAEDPPPARPEAPREAALVPAPRAEPVVPLRETDESGRFAALPAEEPHERRRAAADAGRTEAPPVLPELSGTAMSWGTPGEAQPDPQPDAPSDPLPNPWSDEAVPASVPAPGPVPETAGQDGRAPAGADPVEIVGEIVDAELVHDTREDWRPAGTHAGLPRRVRQESLAPQLRKRPPPPPPRVGGGVSGSIARSPEEARSLMASIQQGWRRGRASDVGDEGER